MLTRTPHATTGRRLLATSAAAALAVAFLAVTSASASPTAGPAQIDGHLDTLLPAGGTGKFFVYLKETADLSGAATLDDRTAKAEHVYETLTSVAETSQADLRAFLDDRGVTYTPFWIANTILVEGDRDLLTDLANRPDVSRIEPHADIPLSPLTPSNTIQQTLEWGVADIGADHAWTVFKALGQGIVVATIDTGVQFNHPALVNQYRGNTGGGTFNHNYNWFDPNGVCPLAPCDNTNHGTHVTGIMVGDDGGANKIGVAPAAKWIAAKGCASSSCSQASLLASGQWMLAPTDLNGQNPDPAKAPHVVNNSWGGAGGNLWYQSTINAWVAAGIFPIFAAGSTGPFCASVGSPGDNISAYAVGAYGPDHSIAPFGARGPSRVDNTTIKPNITAPGVNIRSSITGNGYAVFSGTAMAAPHAAGTVALMWSARPLLTGNVTLTRHILDATAGDVNDLTCGGVPANNNVWGQGRLNAFQAVWLAKTF